MNDTIVVGVALLTNLIAALMTLRAARSIRRTGRTLKSDPLYCSCGHPASVHELKGSCIEQVRVPNHLKNGTRQGKKWITCKCIHFDGIRPIRVEDWSPPS